MLAFGLALLLFFYFLLIGSAAVRWLHASRNKTQDLLLSPAIGVVVALVPTFLLNRLLSIPVAYTGPFVATGLLLAAIIVHRRLSRRSVQVVGGPQSPGEVVAMAGKDPTSGLPAVGWKRNALDYLPFLGILLMGAYLIGRPLLSHGFDWLSFSNDDMANYALAGDRLLRHGFQDLPPVDSLIRGTEYAQSYWYYHVPMMARGGTEMMLAWVCSITGLPSHQAYMPLIVCFHIMLASTASAMILSSADRRNAAICACFLLIASAQLSFGTIYQLIAQDIGLAVLCANATLLLRDVTGLSRGALIRHGVLLGLTSTGQMLIYPEVNPFLGVALFIHLGWVIVRRRGGLVPLLGVAAVAAVLTLVLLNDYTYDVLAFMFGQRTQASGRDDPALTLFPFFLIPSGFANFWGFVQITSMPPDPGFSIAIVLGALCLLLATIGAIWLIWRSGEPAAGLTLVSVVLGIFLFKGGSGFGLYKLAMFAQAFVLPTVALAWALLARKFRMPSLVWLIALLAIPNLRVQDNYVRYSRDESGATFNEIVGATRTKVIREFVREIADAEASGLATKDSPILCDSYNISLTKILAAYTNGREASFPASRLTRHTMIPVKPPESTRDSHLRQARSLWEKTMALAYKEQFQFEPVRLGALPAEFFLYEQGGRSAEAGKPADAPNTLVVASTARISLLNRRHYNADQGNFVMAPLSRVKNHLMFTETEMSEPYYKPGDPKYIALYQLERDPKFFTSTTMSGVGRYFVFEVLNPDEQVRVCFDLTLSLKSDGENRLPPGFAVGTDRQPFDMVGRGACRVISPPIRPQRIRGRYFVGVDLGVFGSQFSVPRTGLMTLYGMDVRLDRRLLVGFGRDISLIGEAEYKALAPPSAVHSWAHSGSELANPDLEYSGLYEDGWLSEHAYLVLGQKPAETRVVIRGSIPNVGNPEFTTSPTLKIDGTPVALAGKTDGKPFAGTLTVGQFELSADVAADGHSRRKVEVDFTHVQSLQGLDTRKTAAQVISIGFERPRP